MVNPMGGSFGPSFDGYQAHNTTTNPYLNTVFEGVNQTENMINAHASGGGFGGPPMGGPGGAPLIGPMGGPGGGAPPMSAGQQFLNNFIDPLTSRAGNEYQSGLQLAQGAQGGGEMPQEGGSGPISGIIKGVGAAAGQIPLVGGLVKGVGDVAGGLVNTLSLGIL